MFRPPHKWPHRSCLRIVPGGVAPAGVVQGSPFPGNIIPTCMISPNAAALLNAAFSRRAMRYDANGNSYVQRRQQFSHEPEGRDRPHRSQLQQQVLCLWPLYRRTSHARVLASASGAAHNVPTVGDTFGNPSYSAVIHTTYTISPTLINEAAFNYNGNRINIIPFAGSGPWLAWPFPTGYVSTTSRLFTGPNNLNRIPNIDLNGGINSHFEISSWPWHNKADDYQIRDDISLDQGSAPAQDRWQLGYLQEGPGSLR